MAEWENVVRSKTTRGEGLVPRWGGRGAWQNPRCQSTVPNHNSNFSYPGVPVPTGISDWYESMSRTPIRDDVTWPRYCPSATALQSTSMPALHRRILPSRRPMVDRGMRKCSAVEDYARRGACPPLGRRRGVAESAVPIRRTKPQLQLFIPWCARGNWHKRLYESMSRTTIRDRPLQHPLIVPFAASLRRRPESRRGSDDGKNSRAVPFSSSFRRRPESRRGGNRWGQPRHRARTGQLYTGGDVDQKTRYVGIDVAKSRLVVAAGSNRTGMGGRLRPSWNGRAGG